MTKRSAPTTLIFISPNSTVHTLVTKGQHQILELHSTNHFDDSWNVGEGLSLRLMIETAETPRGDSSESLTESELGKSESC